MRKQYLNTISVDVQRELQQLGQYLRDARLRRRYSMEHVRIACRMGMNTIKKVEAGAPGVDIGAYLALMEFYGMAEGFSALAAANRDPIGSNGVLVTRRAPKQPGLDNEF